MEKQPRNWTRRDKIRALLCKCFFQETSPKLILVFRTQENKFSILSRKPVVNYDVSPGTGICTPESKAIGIICSYTSCTLFSIQGWKKCFLIKKYKTFPKNAYFAKFSL